MSHAHRSVRARSKSAKPVRPMTALRRAALQKMIDRMTKDAARGKKPTGKQLVALADRIASMSRPIVKPPYAEHLIREDRDSR